MFSTARFEDTGLGTPRRLSVLLLLLEPLLLFATAPLKDGGGSGSFLKSTFLSLDDADDAIAESRVLAFVSIAPPPG